MITQRALDLIKTFEGFRTNAYKDSAGIPTIGYGTIKYPNGEPVKMGDSIDEGFAEELLRQHAEGDAQFVENHTAYLNLNQNQKDALVSFTYNLGRGGLKQLTANGTRTVEEIAAKIPAYNKAGGKVIQGLVNRRRQEAALFSQGIGEGATEDSATSTPQATQGSIQGLSQGIAQAGQRDQYGIPKENKWEGVAQSLINQDWNRPISFADGGYVGREAINFADGGYVNTTVVEKGAANRAALKTFFGKLFDDKQGIHPDVKDTVRMVAEFTPILGDALAAEEIIRELQKTPINWKLIGILGGATLIGVIPGIGDAAAAAIKAGARAALSGVNKTLNTLARLKIEVDPNALGMNLGNVKVSMADAKVGDPVPDDLGKPAFVPKLPPMKAIEVRQALTHTPSGKQLSDYPTEDALDQYPSFDWSKFYGESDWPEGVPKPWSTKDAVRKPTGSDYRDPEIDRFIAPVGATPQGKTLKSHDEPVEPSGPTGRAPVFEEGTVFSKGGVLKDANSSILAANIGMIKSLLNKNKVRPEDWEDALSDATVALFDAADRFNPQSNSKFSTYAYGQIDNAIKNRSGISNYEKRKAANEATQVTESLDAPLESGDNLHDVIPGSTVNTSAAQYQQFFSQFGEDADVAQAMAERASISRKAYKDADGKTKKHKIPSDAELAQELGMNPRDFKIAKKRITEKVKTEYCADGCLISLKTIDEEILEAMEKHADEFDEEYGGPEVGGDLGPSDYEMLEEWAEEIQDGEIPGRGGLLGIRSIYTGADHTTNPKAKALASKFIDALEPEDFRNGSMRPPEMDAWEQLPEEITVFRLQNEGAIDGYSWTISQKFAEGSREHLKQTGDKSRVVYGGIVNKNDISGLFLNQYEREVILKPNAVKGVKLMAYNRGGLVRNFADGGLVW